MATSPNYGWSEPDNTSLVKNGAQAMRTLGDAIDTSVWNIGFGQAGKNKIINGDFGIWQRGTSFTSPSFNQYLADRWKNNNYDNAPTTYSFSRQTFTPGTAPVAGYEGTFFARSSLTTIGTCTVYDTFQQRIEDVRVFAGQTATLSFWAKSDSTRTQQIGVYQNFGSGGSSETTVNAYGTNSISTTTSWQRFTLTLSFPSVSGKTIGTNSFVWLAIRQAAASGSTLDLWGVQLEYGSKATPFQTASGGSPQAELAMCQRYYCRVFANNGVSFSLGQAYSITNTLGYYSFPVPMRIAPTALEQTGTASNYGVSNAALTFNACTAVPIFNTASELFTSFVFITTGIIAGNSTHLTSRVNPAYLAWSAEL
jgi:hypothetical protein